MENEGRFFRVKKETDGTWGVGYTVLDSKGLWAYQNDKSLPNALAKILIHLTEEGILDPKSL